jgi:hypothetical protein
MALETATYISQLTATNPVAADSVSVGDDHIRMLKTVLKTQFSGLSGTTAITSTEAEMNYLDLATLGTSADSKVLTQASGVVTIAGDVVVSGTTPKVTIGDAGAEDTTLLFDGNAQDYYIALDDSADDLLIGLGSTVGTTPAISIDENLAVKTYGDITMTGTTPTLTIGDAGAEDTAIIFDGNAQDFYIALDDSADDLLIGLGNTVGTTPAISIDENLAVKTYGDITMTGTTPTLTIGDAGAEDAAIVFDGNAKDFHVGLDDSSDKLVIGVDSTLGTNTILTLTDDTVTLGDGAAVDTYLNFDGNAVDYRIGIDDGTDKLEIGAAVAHGTTTAIAIDSAADMTIGGYINFSDEQAIRPEIKDYAETVNALGDVAGGTDAIDISAGNVVTATVSTGTQTFTFTNPSATGKACSFTLILTNGGSQTVNWPSAVKWASDSAPSLTSSGVDVITFTTVDAGTTWYGFTAGLNMS